MKTEKKLSILFFSAYFILNILNTFMITIQTFNRYIVPVNYTFSGVLNSILGNAVVLVLYILVVSLFTKKRSKQMIALVVITFVLNGFLFAINVFNRYYGASFTMGALSIFKNPAAGVGMGIAFEAFKEMITYYRIILLIPFFAVLAIYLVYRNKLKKGMIENNRSIFVGRIQIALVLLFLTGGYISQAAFNKMLTETVIIDSAKATFAGQNLGLYQYHLLEMVGINYKNTYDEEAFDIIIENLEKYNKNTKSYQSLVDQNTYDWSPKKKDITNISGQLIEQLEDNESVTGILKDYNLVLIHLETFNHFLLEIDAINAYLPLLKQIMSESYVFENFYTNVGIGNSFDAEISLMTGLNANGTSNLAWDFDPTKPVYNYNFTTLPNLFKQSNYQDVWSVHGDTKKFYNREVVHPEMFGFDYYYAQEEFLKSKEEGGYGYDSDDYGHDAGVWVSDRALFSFLNESMDRYTDEEKFMIFAITMMPHTPFYYDPFDMAATEDNTPRTDKFPEWAEEVDAQTLRYLNFMEYYNDLFNYLFFNDNGTFKYHEKTAFVFYGDHGSGINNGDINTLYGLETPMTNIEMRKKLLQTTSFIYVPDENGNGLLKGSQSLVRGQTDLFRTIVDLFDLPLQTNDNVYSVHGMSQEKTYSIDNKSLDVIIDEGIFNLKNQQERYWINENQEDPLEQLNNIMYMDTLRNLINTFKYYSDMAINYNLYPAIRDHKKIKSYAPVK